MAQGSAQAGTATEEEGAGARLRPCVCRITRFLESNWFVWVTQMNHIPMHIDHDRNVDWVSTQVRAIIWKTQA